MFPLRDNAPTRSRPFVTWALIAANVAVYFLYQAADPQAALDSLAYHPCEVNDSCRVVGEDWHVTAFTSMFMHADLAHLGGNMLFLWIFGNNVEDALGHVRFLGWYVLGGLAATGLQTFVTLAYGAPAESTIPNLGASGAISAVLGGYLLLLPHARVLTVVFYILREIPAYWFLGIWFAMQLWLGSASLLHPQQGGGVAFFAHVGGFVFGFLTVKLFQKRRPLRPAY